MKEGDPIFNRVNALIAGMAENEQEAADILVETSICTLETFFPGMRVTVIIRDPGDLERELMGSTDDFDALEAMFKRMRERKLEQ
jgi:hypothetical protein